MVASVATRTRKTRYFPLVRLYVAIERNVERILVIWLRSNGSYLCVLRLCYDGWLKKKIITIRSSEYGFIHIRRAEIFISRLINIRVIVVYLLRIFTASYSTNQTTIVFATIGVSPPPAFVRCSFPRIFFFVPSFSAIFVISSSGLMKLGNTNNIFRRQLRRGTETETASDSILCVTTFRLLTRFQLGQTRFLGPIRNAYEANGVYRERTGLIPFSFKERVKNSDET